MRILFIADNFPPETNAAAIRTYDHTRIWLKLGHKVTIITGVPNFPMGKVFHGYKNKLAQMEMIDGIRVVRMWTYIAPNRGVFKRMLDFASFMVSATIGGLFVPRPDVVIATSPQFLTSIAGWALAKIKGCPFIFELRDLWPESILAIEALKGGYLTRLLERLTYFIYTQAHIIISVTESFKTVLTGMGISERKIHVVKNGVLLEAVHPTRDKATVRTAYCLRQDAFLVGYVGTIGMAHGLATILEAARLSQNDHCLHFVLMGNGADKQHLTEQAQAQGLHNITFLDRAPHKDAINLLGALDVALILLKNTPLFRTVIPSKTFEAMALGRPIILGAKGESLDLIEEHQCGIGTEPEDATALVENIRRLQEDNQLYWAMSKRGKKAIKEKYNREELARKMLEIIEDYLGGRDSSRR